MEYIIHTVRILFQDHDERKMVHKRLFQDHDGIHGSYSKKIIPRLWWNKWFLKDYSKTMMEYMIHTVRRLLQDHDGINDSYSKKMIPRPWWNTWFIQ